MDMQLTHKETHFDRIHRRQRLASEVRDPLAQCNRRGRSGKTWAGASYDLRRGCEAGADRAVGSIRSGLRKAAKAAAAYPGTST